MKIHASHKYALMGVLLGINLSSMAGAPSCNTLINFANANQNGIVAAVTSSSQSNTFNGVTPTFVQSCLPACQSTATGNPAVDVPTTVQCNNNLLALSNALSYNLAVQAYGNNTPPSPTQFSNYSSSSSSSMQLPPPSNAAPIIYTAPAPAAQQPAAATPSASSNTSTSTTTNNNQTGIRWY